MKIENTVKWHLGLINLLTEDDPLKCDCISITDGADCVEQRIYLFQHNQEYEVRVFKATPQDTYIPNVLDFQITRYEANDEFASFYFDWFFFARRFISTLKDVHPEYSHRPI